jgi:hypothetical protein
MKTFALATVAFVAIGFAALFAGCGGDDSSKETKVPPSTVASAGGVVVDQASVDLGNVPLDKMVTQTWRLRNEGSGKAQLGKPKIEVLEGC